MQVDPSNSCKMKKKGPELSERSAMDILIRKAKKHDREAFSQLIKTHTPSMYKAAKAILKNDEDVADAIQETALTCWEKIGTLKKDKYFKTWLIRILINHCNQIYRQRSRNISEVRLPEEGNVEENFAAVEWKEFLQCLDEKYRIVTILYYVEGFKIREIAQILDINEKTVSGRLATARDRMEKQYTHEKPSAVVYRLKERNQRGLKRKERLI